MKSDVLFSLIKSLTNAEIKYFLRQSREKSGELKYLLLFESLLGMDVYDEEQLRAELKGEKMLNQLPVAKVYLQKMILAGLRSFHFEKGWHQKNHAWLEEISILYQKGQYQLCQRLLKKGLKNAQKMGSGEAELEYLTWQRRFNRIKGEWSREIDGREEAILSDLQRKVRIAAMYDELFALSRKEKVARDPKLKERLQDIQEKLSGLGEPALGFEGKLAWHSAWTILLQLQGGQNQVIFQHMAAIQEIWHSFPKRLQMEKLQYLNSLANYLHFAYRTNQEDAFKDGLASMMAHFEADQDLKDWLEARILHAEMLKLLNQDKFEEAHALIPSVEMALEKNKWGPLAMKRINIIYTCFLAGDYAGAQKRLNPVFIDNSDPQAENKKGTLKILEPVLFYARDDLYGIQYSIRSAERHLRKSGPVPDWATALFRFLKQAEKLKTRRAIRTEEEKLYRVLADGNSLAYQGVFEVVLKWLEGRVEGA